MKLSRTVGLAVRNLTRHRRRTIITAGAVAVGLTLFIIVDSILLGVEEESNRNVIWYETGAAQVIHQQYLPERDDRPLKYAIDNSDRIEAELKEGGAGRHKPNRLYRGTYCQQRPLPRGRIHFCDRLRHRSRRGCRRVPAASDDHVRCLFRSGRKTRSFSADGWRKTSAPRWDTPSLSSRGQDRGYYQTIDLEVCGIAHTPNPIINRTAVFLPKDIADVYLQMDGAATEIAVANSLDKSLKEITREMELHIAGAPDLTVVDWRTIAADAVAIAEAKETGTGVILFLVFIIAAVGVSNTVLMSVLERTRELGMMRAMGIAKRRGHDDTSTRSCRHRSARGTYRTRFGGGKRRAPR